MLLYTNMSNKQTDTWLEYDKELHEEAGLVYSGLNADGEPEYIGTDAQWKKYNKIAYE